MSILPSLVVQSRWGQVWEVVSDLLIAIALIWTLPLLLAAAAVVALVRNAM